MDSSIGIDAVRLPPRCARAYRVLGLLGRGGCGTVVRAKHRGLDRTVALKLVPHHHPARPGLAARLENEARVTALIRHPNVVRVLDHEIEEGDPWVVFEDLGDRDLGKVLNASHRLPVASVVSLGAQLAGALSAAHALGITHRDIKPENVMVTAQDRFTLVDFGLAGGVRFSAITTESGHVVGTPSYFAPEVLNGGRASPASDQYALGVLLYRCLTGAVPHARANPKSLLVARATLPVVPLRLVRPDAPLALEAVVMRMLETDPRARLRSLDRAQTYFCELAVTLSPPAELPAPGSVEPPEVTPVLSPRLRRRPAARRRSSIVRPRAVPLARSRCAALAIVCAVLLGCLHGAYIAALTTTLNRTTGRSIQNANIHDSSKLCAHTGFDRTHPLGLFHEWLQ